MTNTDWIFSEADHSLHQEFSAQDNLSNPFNNTNPAELIIDYPTSFNVTRGQDGDDSFSQLSVDIPSDVMDKLAIAWCKKRRLHGAFVGPVGREFGSVESEYNEEELHNIEQEDAELEKLIKKRINQPETEANLEFDNIFELVENSTEEAERLKKESDELITARELIRQLLPRNKQASLGILNHIISSNEHFLESAWRFEDKLASGIYTPGQNETGQWFLLGTNRDKKKLITPLEPLSVKIIERLIQQNKLIPKQPPQRITEKLRLTMHYWKIK